MHNDDEPGEGATRERKGDLITALLGQSMVKPKGSVCFGLNYYPSTCGGKPCVAAWR
jgi:hypothetical protein